jgi:predicted enzyme related to lactoylglutathione lyase
MDSVATLNLIVIRFGNLEKACRFYEALGIQLRPEQHGSGPPHFSAQFGDVTFELHPLGNLPITIATRLGFRVASVDTAITAAQDAGGALVSAAIQTPWGYRAVVADPEGHRIELTQTN